MAKDNATSAARAPPATRKLLFAPLLSLIQRDAYKRYFCTPDPPARGEPARPRAPLPGRVAAAAKGLLKQGAILTMIKEVECGGLRYSTVKKPSTGREKTGKGKRDKLALVVLHAVWRCRPSRSPPS